MTDAGDELFTLPPQDFVGARNALVKRLRAEGRRGEAAEVKALRRPPASVWALNQLARQQPATVADLIEAGAALPAAQQALLQGHADDFRTALARHRQLIADLAGTGARLVAEREVSSTDQRQEIIDDLRAASTIPEAREPFRSGRLTQHPVELGEADTGLLSGLAAPVAPIPGVRPAARRDPEAEARAAARRRELAEAVTAAHQAVGEAEQEYQDAVDDMGQLEGALERARRRYERAEQRLAERRDELNDRKRTLLRHDADHDTT